ncbi:uncharacterized protein LOC128999244 [Macrosteles quadrilineatus]|uniref:uncharacterized protein LOC128999244 n=1 Tax=Macrosteles quadrilineatus TaxID=74068 RepID=UPI0023E2D147|nr:uncharacterized protein LOC128999244 [Macrosteles quadrilineatus]
MLSMINTKQHEASEIGDNLINSIQFDPAFLQQYKQDSSRNHLKIVCGKRKYTKESQDLLKRFPPNKWEIHPPPQKYRSKFYKKNKIKTTGEGKDEDEFSTEEELPVDPPDEDLREWLERRKMRKKKRILFNDFRTPAEMEADYYSNPGRYNNYGV